MSEDEQDRRAWSRKPLWFAPDNPLRAAGELVARHEYGTEDGMGTLRILQADPFVLISLGICERMLLEPNRYGRIEIKDSHPRPEGEQVPENRPIRTVYFSDDYGARYVYVLGEYHADIECFEARWPD